MSSPDSTSITGKLEVSVKIITVPSTIEIERNWRQFQVHAEALQLTVQLKPKYIARIEREAQTLESWIAVLKGEIAAFQPDGLLIRIQAVEIYARRVSKP